MARRLTLYHYDGCFYCVRVERVLGQLGLLLEHRNVLREPEHRSELIAATGRARVPVLRIEDVDGHVEWMPESRDIIRFLTENYADHHGPRQPGERGQQSQQSQQRQQRQQSQKDALDPQHPAEGFMGRALAVLRGRRGSSPPSDG